MPPDMLSHLYGRLNNPDWGLPWRESWNVIATEECRPSFAFGRQEILRHLHALTLIYKALSDNKFDVRRRAEAGLRAIEETGISLTILQHLSPGVASPLREALRTAQLSPGGDWPISLYNLVGRNDLAEGFSSHPAIFANHGYRSMRESLVSRISFLPKPLLTPNAAPHYSKEDMPPDCGRSSQGGVKRSNKGHRRGTRYR